MATKNKTRPKFLDDVIYLPAEEYEFGVVADKPGKPKNKQFGQRVYAARRPRLTPKQWQEYWGNQGASYVNAARDKVAPYFLAGAGLAAAPALLPYANAIIANPYVDAALTTHGLLTAPKNIRKGVSNFRKGNYTSGAIDFGSVGLDLLGAGLLANKIAKPAARLFNSPLKSRTITQGINITPENAALISPERWTAAQDAAIARGDMVEAQRLRDLHFITYAPNTKIVDTHGNPLHTYHGSNYINDATKKGDWSKNALPYVTYFAPYRYANTPYYYKAYLNIKNPLASELDLTQEAIQDENIFKRFIKDKGYDGAISNEPQSSNAATAREIVVTHPNQVKSADAVTYDDSGVRIPLGLRDNFKLNDIRYGIIPLLGIGAASNFTNRRSSKFH